MTDWKDPWEPLPDGTTRDVESGSLAVFHVGRCGSTVLSSMLRQHPVDEIYWEGEIFGRMDSDIYGYQEIDFRDPIDLIGHRATRCASRIYAFETKIHPEQQLRKIAVSYTPPDFIRDLEKIGFRRFLVIKRRNILRQIVSVYVGRERRRWHMANSRSAELVRVRVDPHHAKLERQSKPLKDLIEEIDTTVAEAESLVSGRASLTLTYEDDVLPDPNTGYMKICSFCGVDTEPVEVTFSRTNPYPLSDVLENYSEIADHLSDTPYCWMLSE